MDDQDQGRTARLLLRRYTDESMGTKTAWQKWLIENRDRIYFTDFGGYKFRAMPKGYPVP
jgi:hypothetical protein